jgi:hypothetical protein
MNIHSVGNAVEAVVWFILAVVVFVAGARHADIRRNAWTASAALVLFGFSDLVEIRTGAWWRPWWLLVWKGSCIAAFIVLLWIWSRRRKADAVTADCEPPVSEHDPSD